MKQGREERALSGTISGCAGRETFQGSKQGCGQEDGKGKPNLCVGETAFPIQRAVCMKEKLGHEKYGGFTW